MLLDTRGVTLMTASGHRHGAVGEGEHITESILGSGPARMAGQRWRRRALAGVLVRGAVLTVPVGAALAAGIGASDALPTPQSGAATVGWYAATLAASLGALLVVDRLARRLLPLAVLLRMTLVFPDRAPSRLAVALSASSRSRLRACLAGVEDVEASDVQSLVKMDAEQK